MSDARAGDTAAALAALRRRADEDFAAPSADRPPGRHQVDLPELGLRVSVTRSRYPNRADGVDQYAVTVTRADLSSPPAAFEVGLVLTTTFGDAARRALERTGGNARVRMFRVPAS